MRVKLSSNTSSRWVEIGSDSFAGDLEEIAASLGTSWRASEFSGAPSFLAKERPDFQALIDFAEALKECEEVHLPSSIFIALCKEHEAVLSPSRIALFGDGQVSSDTDIARAVARETGGEISAAEGRRLREIDGCLIAEGFVAQYI